MNTEPSPVHFKKQLISTTSKSFNSKMNTEQSPVHCSVSEVVFLYDSAEFKGILHITHFFVTIFFVVNAKIDIYPLPSKYSGKK